jgi:hypothetical protein
MGEGGHPSSLSLSLSVTVGLWAAELLRLRARVCQVRSWAQARQDG